MCKNAAFLVIMIVWFYLGTFLPANRSDERTGTVLKCQWLRLFVQGLCKAWEEINVSAGTFQNLQILLFSKGTHESITRWYLWLHEYFFEYFECSDFMSILGSLKRVWFLSIKFVQNKYTFLIEGSVVRKFCLYVASFLLEIHICMDLIFYST